MRFPHGDLKTRCEMTVIGGEIFTESITLFCHSERSRGSLTVQENI